MVIGFFGFPLYGRFIKLVTANFPTTHNEVRRITLTMALFQKAREFFFSFFAYGKIMFPSQWKPLEVTFGKRTMCM